MQGVAHLLERWHAWVMGRVEALRDAYCHTTGRGEDGDALGSDAFGVAAVALGAALVLPLPHGPGAVVAMGWGAVNMAAAVVAATSRRLRDRMRANWLIMLLADLSIALAAYDAAALAWGPSGLGAGVWVAGTVATAAGNAAWALGCYAVQLPPPVRRRETLPERLRRMFAMFEPAPAGEGE